MTVSALLRRVVHATGKLDATRPYLTMFDDISVSVLPTGGSYAYAGYIDGAWPTFEELKRRFPRARLLDMAVFASGNATGLDIENGDATIAEAPGWFERQVSRGVYRPVLYIEASNMKALEQEMSRARIARASYRLWIAHYANRAHVCAPRACGYGLSEADGTQWTQTALGINLDQSILLPDFFDARPAPRPSPKPAPKPAPASPSWEEVMMNSLPTLQQGDHDMPGTTQYVHRAQALVKVIGEINNISAAKGLNIDGVFGPVFTAAVESVQFFFHIKNNGVINPETWAYLVTGHS